MEVLLNFSPRPSVIPPSHSGCCFLARAVSLHDLLLFFILKECIIDRVHSALRGTVGSEDPVRKPLECGTFKGLLCLRGAEIGLMLRYMLARTIVLLGRNVHDDQAHDLYS